MKTLIEAKVEAVNKARVYAAELYTTLTKFFADYVGQEILKVDGQFKLKIKNAMPELPNRVDLSVYRYSSDYNLIYRVKTCVNHSDHSCTYHEESVYIAKIKGNTLEALMDWEPRSSEWTVEKVRAARQAAEDAKKALSKAESNLAPFGYWDN